MALNATSALFTGLVVSIFLSSFLIALVLDTKELGYIPDTLNKSYINPDTGLYTYSKFDFTNPNSSVISNAINLGILEFYPNEWTFVPNQGYVSPDGIGIIEIYNNQKDSNGNYVNTYYINDSVNNFFQITVAHAPLFQLQIFLLISIAIVLKYQTI